MESVKKMERGAPQCHKNELAHDLLRLVSG